MSFIDNGNASVHLYSVVSLHGDTEEGLQRTENKSDFRSCRKVL